MDKYSAYFVMLLLMVSGVTACHTQKKYSISSYQVYLEVQRDGTYHVREHIRFDFEEGAFSSAHLAISLEDIDSVNISRVHSAQTTIDSVVTSRDEETQHIRWYYPKRSEPARFTVDYSVAGALYEEDRRNIVDWDAIGPNWSVPIDSVGANIILPGSFAADRDSISAEPEEESAIIRSGSRWLISFSHAELSAGTVYRVVVSFPRQMEGHPREDIDELTEALDTADEELTLPSWITNVVENPDHTTQAAVIFALYIAVINSISSTASPGGGEGEAAGARAGGGAGHGAA